jgi:hypothetical protein
MASSNLRARYRTLPKDDWTVGRQRIEFLYPLHMGDGLGEAPQGHAQHGRKEVGIRVVRIDLEGTFEIPLSAGPVLLVTELDPTARHVCFGKTGAELQRLGRGSSCGLLHFLTRR